MKTAAIAAICIALTATGVGAGTKVNPSKSDDDPGQITISCFRGPWKDVIWDRPNAVFIDDLVQIGYTLTEASWLAERVCRDEYGVYDEEYIVDRFKKLLAENPPSTKRRRK